jgi:hypothetical protein
VRRFMKRNGNNQGDDPGRGRIECDKNLLRHGTCLERVDLRSARARCRPLSRTGRELAALPFNRNNEQTGSAAESPEPKVNLAQGDRTCATMAT